MGDCSLSIVCLLSAGQIEKSHYKKAFRHMTEKNYNNSKQEGARHLTGADIGPRFANMKVILSVEQAMAEVELSPDEVKDDQIVKAKLFEFVRSLINVELYMDIEMTHEQKMNHVQKWWNQNCIPLAQDEELKQEIIKAILKANLPLFNSPLSYCRALAEEQIKEKYGNTLDLKSKNLKLLCITLYELQTITGPKPFYASASKLESALGQYSAKHCWDRLNRLEFEGYIKKIKNGKLKGKQASEFIYLEHPCWEADEAAKAELKKLTASVSLKNRVLKSIKRYRGDRGEMGLITGSNLNLKEVFKKCH
jgi:hypothetical protein